MQPSPAQVGAVSQAMGQQAIGYMRSINVPGMYSTVSRSTRSWVTDFAAPSRFLKPGDDWAVRLRTNLLYFRSNYSLLFAGFLVFSILSNPILLFAMVVLSAAWTWLLAQRNPTSVTIASKSYGPFEQKAVLAVITFIGVAFTGLSSTLFWALGVSTVAIGAHAVTHTTEFHVVEASEFGAGDSLPEHRDSNV